MAIFPVGLVGLGITRVSARPVGDGMSEGQPVGNAAVPDVPLVAGAELDVLAEALAVGSDDPPLLHPTAPMETAATMTKPAAIRAFEYTVTPRS
jgi:hypothetical protein